MTRLVQIGMGPLGARIYRMALEKGRESVVAAVDISPQLAGTDAGVHCGATAAGFPIADNLNEALKARPEVAVLTTVSDMERISPQILEIVSHGIPVVSTCEELSYPWDEAPELARQIDQAAKAANVAVLGTGVNPGFLMDSLPTMLTGVCSHVEKVEVSRYQDAQFRRIPFQQKIGAGLTPEQYEVKKATGTLRHVGLTESMQFIARHLGWILDRTEDVLSPVIASQEVRTDAMVIPAGNASGVRQVGSGYVDGVERIRLVFQAAVGEPESYDEIRITGTPDINSRISGGVNGDIATCAITLNAVHAVLNAKPGLRTMGDVGLVSCR